jgi:hypothetical protein
MMRQARGFINFFVEMLTELFNVPRLKVSVFLSTLFLITCLYLFSWHQSEHLNREIELVYKEFAELQVKTGMVVR